jgi:hypothetical protein
VRADRKRLPKPYRDHLTMLIDGTLEDSFPASDPPSWTTSVARPAPARTTVNRVSERGLVGRVLQRVAALF